MCLLPGDHYSTDRWSAALQALSKGAAKGMVLPFRPLNMAFSHMYYSVDMPPVGH